MMVLFAWEDELLHLFSDTMLGAYIRRDVEDARVWKIGDSKAYSVKLTYDFLFSNSLSSVIDSGTSDFFKKFWVSCVSSKVLAFSWRLMLDRLPTRINLPQRHVLSEVQQRCCV